MTQENPNHHQIPKHYLRGFCEPNTTFVWVFEPGRPFYPGKWVGVCNPVRRNIKRVAIRPDGYAVRSIDGKTHYDYEDALQKIEVKATPAINKIRAFKEIEASEKWPIAQYILMMAKRRPSRDTVMLSQVEKAKSKVVEAAECEMRRAAFDGQFAKAIEMQRQAEYWDSEGDTQFLRDSMIGDIGMVRQALTTRPWEFVTTPPGHHFVTSDNPVGNVGLATCLIFPLSQNVVLMFANNGKDLAYRKAAPEEVLKLNTYTISQAEKEIYSPHPDEWISASWAERLCKGPAHENETILL